MARIAYIQNLEEGLGIRREVLYAAALLHDIGKALQYKERIPHEIASAEIAGTILNDLGDEFSKEEKASILQAIRGHRSSRNGQTDLERLLYESDKKSRLCFICPAEAECNWEQAKKEYGGRQMKIGTKNFDTKNHCYIMGILNVTPDSFSDGGKFDSLDAALFHAEEMVNQGADILDVGGESTRPGHIQITEDEEIARVTPVIEQLKKRFDVPVSIDTYKSRVAEAALQSGADLVNDIWGLKYDENMAEVIARHQAACCLMQNREQIDYTDYVEDVLDDLRESVQIAKAADIPDDRIMLDPGVGFGKTYEMNLEIIRVVGRLKELGYPVLLGTSRKSVIGLTLDLPADQREEGTLVTTVLGVEQGCSFVRVHDVETNARAIRMAEAIFREHDLAVR